MKRNILQSALIACLGAGLLVGGIATAHAAVITYTDSFDDLLTDINNQNLSVSMFDPSLGTLTGVQVTLSGVYSVDSLFLTNNGGTDASISYNAFGQYDATAAAGNTVTGLAASYSIDDGSFWGSEVAKAWSGVISAGETVDAGSGFFDETFVINIAAADIASFAGNGTFGYDFTTISGNQMMGAGSNNVTSAVTNTADGSLSVTYTYTPASSVPEPATMLLFGTGIIGFAGLRRKKM